MARVSRSTRRVRFKRKLSRAARLREDDLFSSPAPARVFSEDEKAALLRELEARNDAKPSRPWYGYR